MKAWLTVLALVAGVVPAEAVVRVTASTSDLASIAKAVGGDLVEVTTLCEGTEDPHFVEALPSHMLTVRRADVLFRIGLDFEPWVDDVVLGSRNPKLRVVDCSDQIEILEIPEEPVEWRRTDLHREGNPHYWLDPANGTRIAHTMAAALIEIDPGREKDYLRQRNAFIAELNDKLREWKDLMKPFEGSKIVYGHKGWSYFSRAFGLEAIEHVEREPGVGPEPGHAEHLIGVLKRRHNQILVVSPLFDDGIPHKIASESWAEMVTLGQSVGAQVGAHDYISLFDVNLKLLTDAIKRVR